MFTKIFLQKFKEANRILLASVILIVMFSCKSRIESDSAGSATNNIQTIGDVAAEKALGLSKNQKIYLKDFGITLGRLIESAKETKLTQNSMAWNEPRVELYFKGKADQIGYESETIWTIGIDQGQAHAACKLGLMRSSGCDRIRKTKEIILNSKNDYKFRSYSVYGKSLMEFVGGEDPEIFWISNQSVYLSKVVLLSHRIARENESWKNLYCA